MSPSSGKPRCRDGILWVALILGLGLVAGGAAAKSVEPRVAFDKPVLEAGRTTTIHLQIDFDVAAPTKEAEEKRPPLNLALVLDRSGSMEEARKITYLRDAALIAVDRLVPHDRIAVVEYDDRISVLWRSQPARELASLKQLIRNLSPRGSTDLAGGLVAGIDQARPHVGTETITRVILMTDGLANHGVTEPAAIRRIARQAKARGVRTTTIGLGLDFNETLLQGIAETGGGTYYYVENPRQMVRIFAQELQALATTVARDCIIRIEIGGAVRKAEPIGLPSRTEGSDTIIELEDFYAGETRSLLIRLDVAAVDTAGAMDLGRVKISYYDTVDGTEQEATAALAVETTDQPARVQASLNRDVVRTRGLAIGNMVELEAVERMEAGEVEEARRMLQDLAEDLAEENAVLQDRTIAAKIEALELQQERLASPSPAAPMAQSMAKTARSQAYQVARGKTVGLLLQEGDTGPEVARLIEALSAAGLFQGPVQEAFDAKVADAVRAYQQREGLTVDGVAGPATLDRLGLY